MTPKEHQLAEGMRLCRRAALKFARGHYGQDFEDLVQIAAVGLTKALSRYEPREGVPFGGYAWRLIIGELQHWVREQERVIRTPRRVRELAQRFRRTEDAKRQELGRDPTLTEVSDALRLTPRERRDVQFYRASSDLANIDGIPAPKHCDHAGFVAEVVTIEQFLRTLRPRQRTFFAGIVDGASVTEAADRAGLPRRHGTRLLCRMRQELREFAS